jgi:hypothetical protein
LYFDLEYYWRVLRHVWSLKQWPGRTRMLLRLLLQVPLGALFHSTCFVLDYVFFPALWRQRVEKPVFIIGHARSGTTLLHRLMAADTENFSYFLYWEMFFPSLLQKKCIRALGQADKRWLKGRIKQRLVAWDDKTFGRHRHIHNMSLWNSEEDQFVMRGAFVTQQWALEVPMLDIIDLFHMDQMPEKKKQRWLHHYRECIKRQLLLSGGNKTHLSKNPLMCGWVEALIQNFPGARIAVMMRNPLDCMPSVLKLVEISWRGKGWSENDYADSLRQLTDISFESFTHPREVLSHYPDTPQTVVDYRRLTSEPRDTVHALYQSFDLEISTDYDLYLTGQQQREKAHVTSFEYSIDDYEHLTADRIKSELTIFFEEYQWTG